MTKLLQIPMIGRLGNLLFIYAHARAWADQNGYELCMLPWIGERVFAGVPEAVRPDKLKPNLVWPERMYQNQESLIYTRKQAREWFKLRPEIEERLQPAKCPRRVCLNVRQGKDYRDAGLVTLSKQCYAVAAFARNYDVDDMIFETDVNPTTLIGFEGDFNSGGFGVSEVVLPSFYRLITAPVLFRANSTFSFWAAALAQHQTLYSPVIQGLKGGAPDTNCIQFIEGNWPVMARCPENSDLHLREE